MTIGSNIKKLRRERDITQEHLAEFLHKKECFGNNINWSVIL